MELRDFMLLAVNRAGKIACGAGELHVGIKGSGGRDIVTQVDLEVEKLIRDDLSRHYPDHALLSEETQSSITPQDMPKRLWILDPIDGTVNLRYGRKDSAISLAYAEDGEIMMGAAYNPFNGELYFAEKGKGSFMNGKRLQVGKQTELGIALMGMDNRNDPDKMKKDLQAIVSFPSNSLPQLRLCGSGVLQLCSVASQRLDLYYHPELKPWDKAASLLVIEEAGGTVKDLNGKRAYFMKKGVVAGNNVLVDKFLSHLHEVTSKKLT